MDKLIDYICEELEQLERKADKDGKLTMSEVQYLDILAHAKKNLLKGEELYEEMEGGYSQRSSGYSGESSYARGRGRNARRDSMGRYSRERGGSSREGGGSSRERGGSSREGGYSRYSRESGYSMADEDMVEELRTLMENAPDERTRMEFEKMISRMEQMR